MTNIEPRFNQINIEQIFNKGQKYRVADFQRQYTWKTEEQRLLVSDFISHVHESKNNLFGEKFNENFFFLGTVITFANEQDKKDGVLYIVDGQQRLISISILLVVIRDILKVDYASNLRINKDALNLANRIADRITEILTNKTTTGEASFVILPHIQAEQKFFENILYASDMNQNVCDDTNLEAFLSANPQAKKYYSAYKTMKNEIKEYIASGNFRNAKSRVDWLVSLYIQIQHSSIIELTMDNDEDAYQIYSDINFKGMPLTNVDRLKNNIMKKVKLDKLSHKEIVLDLWNKLQDNTQNVNFMTFYKYAIFIINGKRAVNNSSPLGDYDKKLPDEQDLPDIFNEEFQQQGQNSARKKIQKLLGELNKINSSYQSLIDSDFSLIGKNDNWPFYSKNLKILYDVSASCELESFVYFLIPTYNCYSKKIIKPNDLKKWIDLLNDFYFIGLLNVCIDSNNVEIKEAYKELHDELFIYSSRIIDKDTFVKYYELSNNIFSEFLSNNFDTIYFNLDRLRNGNTEKKNMNLLCTYFLRQLEGNKINKSASIEHIMDKEYGKDNIHGNPYHAVGNLIMLENDLNNECEKLKDTLSTASQRIKYKESVYKKSNSETTKIFMNNFDLSTFSDEAIIERTQQMSKQFISKYCS
ncbi:DUF262 domain-containing protein [Fructobacillus durionis]|uniref:GmrSD restriction endonucleases N-terminal domain-containing protein n=1 Tax=Fructobacillus durionis TaxID=283737 RepID=A0A1I1EAA3_9LACO|nr:DUF262 domain-containing protein [Fructobacillus durionis]SFB84049.1 Protein of unknown function DUF262 [Fructobacillus durionis]